MTIGYLYRDRRYEDDDDESVPDTNFDYDTETVDFDAPPVDQLPAEPEPLPPPTSAFSGVYAGEHQDNNDDELRQLSNRRGKVKCWVLIIFGLLAACALAVSLTFFLKPTNESIVQRPRRDQTHLQAYPYQLCSQPRYHILQLFGEQEHYAHILLHLLELMAKLQIRPAAQQQQLLLLILHL